MPLHSPRAAGPPPQLSASVGPATPYAAPSHTAAVEPYMEHIARDGASGESEKIVRAWKLYDTPEVRFAVRQYANAFSSAKLVLGKRDVPWHDPVPIETPSSKSEEKAMWLLESFAGGPVGQVELLDRIGMYFMVTGDMVLSGAYDPMMMEESKFARWDVWSTGEIRWTGRNIQIREHAVDEIYQDIPEYVKHLRVWNRHPHYGWLSDSPLLAALDVLDLAGLYDDRMAAEAISRLIGAGVWFLPQGLKLPSTTGLPGNPQDFVKLLSAVAGIAIKNRRSAAANVPIMVEAAAEDIEAAAKGLVTFSTEFADKIGDLQERAFRRWATGVDLPAENMLGLSQATHWNASLITEDKVQSFIVPSLRRTVGNTTIGWLRPALAQFNLPHEKLELWFDPSGIKTRVDTADESEWAYDRFLVGAGDAKYAMGLGQTKLPEGEELKRQLLMHMAKEEPGMIPDILRELGIATGLPSGALKPRIATEPAPNGTSENNGKGGPQRSQETGPAPASPGRTTNLSTQRGG